MPWNVEHYPLNWDELARACKERANWHCEHCGVADGTERVGKKRGRVYRVRIAAAHIHHDPANPEPALLGVSRAILHTTAFFMEETRVGLVVEIFGKR
jgi:hypothetical protein